jgi:hypothetical protein
MEHYENMLNMIDICRFKLYLILLTLTDIVLFIGYGVTRNLKTIRD